MTSKLLPLTGFYPEFLKLYVVGFQDSTKWNAGQTPAGFDIHDFSNHKDLTKYSIDDDLFHLTDLKGLTFDGVNDALYIGNADASHLQMQDKEMTILIVYNNNNLLGGTEVIFSFGTDSVSGDYLAFFYTSGGTDRVYWRFWDDTGYIAAILTDARLRDNNNHLLILRKYYSGGDSYVSIDCPDLSLSYINFRLTDNELLSDDNFVLGSRSLGVLPVQGLFSEYAFWIGKSVSDAEVTWLYENCYSRKLGLL